MDYSRPGHRAVVRSSIDLDGDQVLSHSCDDCACEVSRNTAVLDRQASAASPGTAWVGGREIVEIPLVPGYRVVFNPLGHGGVVVLDDLAATVFAAFARPGTLGAARARLSPPAQGEFAQVADRLQRLQLIEPVGRPVRPTFASAGVLTAWLHLTNDCNLRCPYCYLDTSGERMDETVGRAAVAAVVRTAVDHGFGTVKLKYAGGEATMNQQVMMAIHRYARELTAAHGLDLRATLLTNGVALSEKLLDELRCARIRVMISLDGIGEQHDRQRPTMGGKPSFRLVARTIDRLVALGHRPQLSVTVTNRNATGLAKVVRFALERGLMFNLNLFRDNERAARYADLRYAEHAVISALLDSFAVVEEYLPPWSVLGRVLDCGQLVQPRRHACGVGRDYLVIDQRGRLAACHMDIERTIGDLFHDDPLALIRSDRSTVRNLAVDDKPACQTCAWRYWCSGGCPVAAFRATGHFDGTSPNCGIYRAVYPQALRLEGLRILRHTAGNAARAC